MAGFDRHPDDAYDPDRLGSFHEDRDRMAEADPRGGEDEARPLLLCPVCFKPVAAMKDCGTCGDSEEMAA